MPIEVTNDDLDVTFSVSDLVSLTEDEQAQVEQGNALDDMVQVYMTQADERVRPEHAALHNTVWDANDPNAPTPPLGPGCRCWLEFRAKNKTVAKKTGLQAPPTDAPDPGDEALEEFWKEAEQSEDSQDPGAQVTPVDTFGPTTGKKIEEGKIKPIETFDKTTGEVRAVSEVTDIAKANEEGRSSRSVLSAFAILDSLAVSPGQRQKIIRQAIELLKTKPTLSDAQALFDVTLRLRPGLVGTPSSKQTRSNARRVSRALLRSNGPLIR